VNPCTAPRPCIRSLSRPVEPPSIDEIRYLVAIASSMPNALDLRDVMALMLNVGLTPGELLRLRCSDINFDERFITVSSTTGGVLRCLSFGEKVFQLLRVRYEANGSTGFVLGVAPNLVLCRASRQLRCISTHICTNTVTLVAIQHAFARRVFDSLSDAALSVPAFDCRYVPPTSNSNIGCSRCR
jgi:integrase